jgi:hypothetical protein
MEVLSVSHLEPGDNARLTGATLATKVRKMTVAQRAALAVRLQSCDVSGLLPAQAAALTKVAVASVRLAGGASEADFSALRRDRLSLNQLRNKNRRCPTPAEIEAFVDRAGIERVMGTIAGMTEQIATAAE